jgi:sec-independent protein translocase protein TatB
MFDIGWSELVVIGVVALIAIGPKELPGALRTLGQWMGKIRRMASEFQNQFNEAMREAEMADLKKQVDNLTSGFDPIETTRKELETAMEDKPAAGMSSAASSETTPAYDETPPVETTVPDDPVLGDPVSGDPVASRETVASAPVAPAAPGEHPVENLSDTPAGEARPEPAGGRPA